MAEAEIATNVSADRESLGKTADLVLVEGDASERLSDLRQTRVVILDGKLMDADALRTAAGFSGLPK